MNEGNRNTAVIDVPREAERFMPGLHAGSTTKKTDRNLAPRWATRTRRLALNSWEARIKISRDERGERYVAGCFSMHGRARTANF